MAALSDSAHEPFLRHHSPSSSSSVIKSGSSSDIGDEIEEPADPNRTTIYDRSLESDVIPETAVLGRNLGWSSAYILTISSVIGSGIFATPGAIVRSVGSVGIALVLWVVGALFAWFGLAVTLEYGCMLPRSGGKKANPKRLCR